jgi:hypothetical protein
MNDNPSICIPRIDYEISKWEISDIFNKLNIGRIHKIDLLYNYKNKTYKIFVHFKNWFDNETSCKIRDILNNGGNFKIVYKFPHYWKCFKSKFS